MAIFFIFQMRTPRKCSSTHGTLLAPPSIPPTGTPLLALQRWALERIFRLKNRVIPINSQFLAIQRLQTRSFSCCCRHHTAVLFISFCCCLVYSKG